MDTLGDWRRGSVFRGAIRLGWFSRVLMDDQLWHAYCKALIALSWALYTAIGVSLMAPVSVLMLWRMRSVGVSVGAVIYLWRNSTVSETVTAFVSRGITYSQQ